MECRILKTNEEVNKSFDLRYDVFVLEQNVPKELEIDKKDFLENTIHVGVFDEDSLIAVGRILDSDMESIHFGRIAVNKNYRKKGIGKFLVLGMEKISKKLNVSCKMISLNAQITVIGFYEKLGYIIENDVTFLDAGIEHKTMFKKLD